MWKKINDNGIIIVDNNVMVKLVSMYQSRKQLRYQNDLPCRGLCGEREWKLRLQFHVHGKG